MIAQLLGALLLLRAADARSTSGGALALSRSKGPEPMLCIVRLPSHAGPTRSGAVEPGAVALALGGLPADALPQLRTSLADATDAAVRRAVPLFLDLDEDPAAVEAASLDQARQVVPAVTAAANLGASTWAGPGIAVTLATACGAEATRSVPLFATPEDDPLVRRGRALAWALAHAAILRPPPGARATVLRALRANQPSGTIALIFEAPEGRLDAEQVRGLRAEARRALAHVPAGAPQRAWLEGLSGLVDRWQLPVALKDGELLVVPRLSALARLPQFEAELAAAGSFEWVVRPDRASKPPGSQANPE